MSEAKPQEQRDSQHAAEAPQKADLHKKRRRFRRIIFALTALAVVLIALVVVAIARPGWLVSEDRLRSLIIATLSEKVHREVEIGRMEFSRLGRVKLKHVVIKSGEEPARPPLMQVGSFTLYVRILPLLRGQIVIQKLNLRHPSFCLDTDYLAKMKFERPPPKADEIIAKLAVESLLIEDGTLTLLDEEGKEAFSVTNFDVDATGAQYQPLDYNMSFHIEGEGITGDVRSTGTFTAFRDSGHQLDVEHLSFDSPPLQARFSGKITNSGQGPNLSMALEAEGNLGALRQLLNRLSVPIPNDLAVEGKSKMRLKFAGPLTDLAVEGVVDVPEDAVSYKNMRLMRWANEDDLVFLARLQENQIELKNVTIKSSLGQTAMSGKIQRTLTEPSVDLQLDSTMNLTEISKVTSEHMESSSEDRLSIAGEAISAIHVSGPTSDLKVAGGLDLSGIEVARGEEFLKKKGEKASVSLNGRLRDNLLEIGSGTVLKTGFGTLAVTGTIPSDADAPMLHLDLSAEADPARGMALLPESQRRLLTKWHADGKATGSAKIDGTFSDFSLAGKIDLAAIKLDYENKPFLRPESPAEIRFDLRATESDVTLNSVEVLTDPASLRVRGKILNIGAGARPDLEFDLTSSMERLTACAVEHGVDVIPVGATLSGSLKVIGSVRKEPAETLRINSKVDLADCEFRYQDVILKPRHYKPDIKFDVSYKGNQLAIDSMSYDSQAIALSGWGKFEKDGKLTANLKSSIEVGQFQPLVEAILRQEISGIDTSRMSPEEMELVKSIPDDLKISGKFSAAFGLSADLSNVELGGSLNTSAIRIDYRDVPLIKTVEVSGLDFTLRADKEQAQISRLLVNSDVGMIDINGAIALEKNPHFNLNWGAEFQTDRWLASLPIEEICADDKLSKLLDKYGIRPQRIRQSVRTSGAAVSRFNLKGRTDDFSASGFLDMSKLDLQILNDRGRSLIHKAAGTRAKIDLDAEMRDEECVLNLIRVEHDDDVFSARGPLALSKGRISAEKVVIEVNDKKAEAALDIAFSQSRLTINRAAVRQDENLWDLAGEIEYTEDQIRIDDFHIGLNKSKALLDLTVKTDADPGPEISMEVLSPSLDLREIIPAIKLPPTQAPSSAEAASADTKLIPEVMPEKLETFLRNARMDAKLLIGNLLLDIDDQQDREPGIRHYDMKNVSLRAQLHDGVCRSVIKGVLNEGIIDFEWNADFNGDLPQNALTYWADGVKGDDNLRPLMNFIFNNLYVLGEMGFDGSVSWQGLSGHNMNRTMYGKAKMYIDEGYLLGKAAPEYMIRLFPWLSLGEAKWYFKKSTIVSVAEGAIATNNMRFKYPGSTYLNGTTNNIAKEVNYVFGVDLVDSLGLGESTGFIPDNLETKSSVDICRYVGTVNDQRVEWFKLRRDEITSILKRLFQIQAFTTLLSPKKTNIEKVDYMEGNAIWIITAPARAAKAIIQIPGRMMKKTDERRVEKLEK